MNISNKHTSDQLTTKLHNTTTFIIVERIDEQWFVDFPIETCLFICVQRAANVITIRIEKKRQSSEYKINCQIHLT